jgi:hypothetical protein
VNDSGNPAKLRSGAPGRRAAGEYFNPSKNYALRRRPPSDATYWLFGVLELPELPVELPLELPELPLLEPAPLVLGEVGELGDVVELLPPLAAPLLPVLLLPLAPEPDLLKCASHSERDTWPSLFLSTEEKLGVEALLLEPDIPPLEPLVLEPPEAALPDDLEVSDEPDELLPEAAGEDDEPDEPEELLPDAAGEDDELPPDAAGEDEDEELCATATLDSANNAAAVAALRTLSFNMR